MEEYCQQYKFYYGEKTYTKTVIIGDIYVIVFILADFQKNYFINPKSKIQKSDFRAIKAFVLPIFNITTMVVRKLLSINS